MNDRPPVSLILASRNAHKIVELRRMVPWIDWQALPEALGDPPETGDTFVHNALQKARYVFEKTGSWALADDSGLEVDALGGRPGVHSKRFSVEAKDETNNFLLLQKMRGVRDRRARFRCVIAVVGPGGEGFVEAKCEGQIGSGPRGFNGFGYDPLFFPFRTPGKSMGQLDAAAKDANSHRGRAVRLLPGLLATLGLSATDGG